MGNSRRTARAYDNNLLIAYNCAEKTFQYPAKAEQFLAAKFDNRPLWEILKKYLTAAEYSV